MIPVPVIVMSLIGQLGVIAGIIIFVWRWKYNTRFDHFSPEDQKMVEAWYEAYCYDLRWAHRARRKVKYTSTAPTWVSTTMRVHILTRLTQHMEAIKQ
jgi:hypothetical protein